MAERFWGEDQDREAAKQLGLEGDPTIFMMGSQIDYIDDFSEVRAEFDELGLVSAEEIIDAVEERMYEVKLPKGFALVGMKPMDADNPKTYGIVEFPAHREAQREPTQVLLNKLLHAFSHDDLTGSELRELYRLEIAEAEAWLGEPVVSRDRAAKAAAA